MALDFPTTPANGFVYTSPTGEQWIYETATNSWTSKGLVNSSGGIKYVGTLDITAAPPTGVTGGALYTVAADGNANAGFGPGVTGALTKGDSVMNTGAGWIKLSHPTSVWLKTGTNLAPTATGDVVNISAGTAALPGLTPVGDPNTGIYSPGADRLAISTGGIQRATIDSSGKLLVGTSSDFDGYLNQVSSTSGGSLLSLRCASSNPGSIKLSSGASGDNVGSGGLLGYLRWHGFHTSADYEAARIEAQVDGTAGVSDMPGRLVFSTTADGAAVPTERMRIDSTGLVTLAGPGIRFPATAVASTDPNTLDDYEEGTWTPIASRLSGGGITASYGDVLGKYTKIGRMVTISCYLQITSVASQGSSSATISGLPFSPPVSLTSAGAVFYNTAATTLVIGAAAPHVTGHVYFHENTNNGNLASFNWQVGIISFTISYEL